MQTKIQHLENPGFEKIQGLYGGYHRYDFTDHAYLYNLYFPPRDILDHLKTQLKELVANYPVGQRTLAQLLSRWSGLQQEHLVVGNGAAELIKIISGTLEKSIVIPVPSFNEYINAGSHNNIRTFALEPPFFQLDITAFGEAAVEMGVDIAVIVSPNNPTSLKVPDDQVRSLARFLGEYNIRLIVDESFIDFAESGKELSLEAQLAAYPNTAVIKSMSKAFGICGLRLGYMASSDEEWINRIRQGVHIWNINSIAEEFLRVLPEFRNDFYKSCRQVMADRDDMYKRLKLIQGVQVLKPDANFVFVKLPDSSAGAGDIARQLYEKHRILIKDCKGKALPDSDRYLRIASRTQEENERLVQKLSLVISQSSTRG